MSSGEISYSAGCVKLSGAITVTSSMPASSAIPAIRYKLTDLQQAMGERKSVIMDGRDIGTVVLPNANSLLKLGYMPSVNISTFDFQNLLFKIQFLNEYMSEGK